ncbi:50S ribosomal protein L13 [Candidatus Woesebacteria bacterium RIFCSPHIGHO2_02_FULL_42_20]|uniref:Large ribosomal subunit protein uL13 n=1 Tax=Candidatus Woesebacteria bacterium RIFCSPHIGHO2_12_FULL_41_24 TaxID=1802510 RepID=A0A1F8APG9_9BACT|nr:MAG: 50S ribosomal protein L13 [Candidatus Woesebacteria bacterium RBG_16_41_13]OGM29261.1 MAG: 50S ribosomal protein L13 [Candidatus Woesebacteria bacterium RIFCSPHIGHO2_01_FULL_42_80]OGM34761.1 MAG: 50S ribosomal protein L13 [Candidatus Woesebacteria bacterium RIFCSPHIGHO2_02_FULL_42_20]OGM53652.1 MAG: 50S ribosomal protein L13 [Candidatus Woesebacteria bacterium RIFCSPHIGHO2_12_FULL_41_24]OGM67058.1 MAG: 50S ribosomal protein L13 [Candidatus Woesebacteria bacterium RIFCSPLOWO2_01_FULL_42_
MKTHQPKVSKIKRDWHLMDAASEPLGRLASRSAYLLIGKNKKDYTPNYDMGDFVVVVNARKVKVTGKKASQKVYRSHSGYPGGFKEVTFKRLSEKKPEDIIKKAVFGMLPDNRLKKFRLKRLMVVAGSDNPFQNKFEGK